MISFDIERKHPECKLAVDLCCKAGGTSMGLWQAGFEMIGIDKEPQPNYPFQFILADATELDPRWLYDIADFLSLSPPCQYYSTTAFRSGDKEKYPALIPPLRDLALSTGLPYMLENVENARKHMLSPVCICGSGLGLRVRRHRLFESNLHIAGIQYDHEWQDYSQMYEVYVGREFSGYRKTGVVPAYGGGQMVGGRDHFYRSVAMGIDWMTTAELNEAIPPSYAAHLGRQVLKLIR